jgi:altronate hydrolase
MYQRLNDDMDVNAGVIIEGRSVHEVGRQIFEEILEVASGKKTRSEIHGIGDDEFVPWAPGPQL